MEAENFGFVAEEITLDMIWDVLEGCRLGLDSRIVLNEHVYPFLNDEQKNKFQEWLETFFQYTSMYYYDGEILTPQWEFTPLLEILDGWKKRNPRIYEFDFKQFFQTLHSEFVLFWQLKSLRDTDDTLINDGQPENVQEAIREALEQSDVLFEQVGAKNRKVVN